MDSQYVNKFFGELIYCSDWVPEWELAERLGVGREEVKSIAQRLLDGGFPLEVESGSFYRLSLGDDLSKASSYSSVLDSHIPFRVLYFEECSSTQDVAAKLAGEGVGEGLVVVAEEQRVGRGRLGRSWVSFRGGLWLTIVLEPPSSRVVQVLSLGLGVAVAKTLRLLYSLDAKVKWPNDVQVEGRKVSGILVEASAGERFYVLAGIGVNANNDLPDDLKESADSLKRLLGRRVSRVQLLLALLKEVDKVYSTLKRESSLRVVEEWKKFSSTIGERVRVIGFDGEYTGLAVDVDEQGGLVVETGGVRRVFYSGDVLHLR
ncbi:MAG: biotin--[acetyl-CoA-carboxylase] ligase [Thermofilaceae archaeon]|nr:biotin--[acetyl-CoA-carboxylase] ligase [Thermofilaceae archaeon]MCX8179965.1 biotin--[acetyl-CoA-carboxylase] ligase [Thermofilaceae archaeon]MDW8004730.1 biotin--[acetyl-CoA-carboxylase] ligase [Thermofilaceae archaeon]